MKMILARLGMMLGVVALLVIPAHGTFTPEEDAKLARKKLELVGPLLRGIEAISISVSTSPTEGPDEPMLLERVDRLLRSLGFATLRYDFDNGIEIYRNGKRVELDKKTDPFAGLPKNYPTLYIEVESVTTADKDMTTWRVELRLSDMVTILRDGDIKPIPATTYRMHAYAFDRKGRDGSCLGKVDELLRDFAGWVQAAKRMRPSSQGE